MPIPIVRPSARPSARPAVRWLSALALGTAVVAALACMGGGEEEVVEDKVAVLQPQDVHTVHMGTIAAGPRISGNLEAAHKAVLRAEIGGSVTKVQAELGDRVTAGQVLARIDNAAAGSGFASARSGVTAAEQQLANAEREQQRVGKLVDAGALAPRDLEGAESAVKLARAQLDGARAQRAAAGEQADGTTIRSPLDGVISERAVNDGDIVGPGAPLFTVIEPSSLRLEGSVSADAVSLVQPKTPVTFAVQGYPGRSFEGEVERVAPAVDPATRQIPVLVSVPNQEGKLLAGLFADGRLAAYRRDGLVVPLDALGGHGDTVTVLRIRDGKVEEVAVEIGLRDFSSEVAEVTQGLQEGDQVVVGAARSVEPGTKVELREGDAATGGSPGAGPDGEG